MHAVARSSFLATWRGTDTPTEGVVQDHALDLPHPLLAISRNEQGSAILGVDILASRTLSCTPLAIFSGALTATRNARTSKYPPRWSSSSARPRTGASRRVAAESTTNPRHCRRHLELWTDGICHSYRSPHPANLEVMFVRGSHLKRAPMHRGRWPGGCGSTGCGAEESGPRCRPAAVGRNAAAHRLNPLHVRRLEAP